MRIHLSLVLVLAALVPGARAQEAVLASVAGGGPVMLEAVGPVAAAGTQTSPLAVVLNTLSVDIGFEYLRPAWRSDSVALPLPAGFGAGLGDTGDLSHSFTFVPRIAVDYQFTDLGFGIGASGKVINISGNLERTAATALGTATLTSRGEVDIISINPLEVSKILPLERCECFQQTHLEDALLVGTLGTRYATVEQTFHADFAENGAISSVDAHQDFAGIGLTTSLTAFDPWFGNFGTFGAARFSLLVGNNNRDSATSVVVPGNAAASFAAKANESKTDLVTSGEFEAGVVWGTALGRPSPAGTQAPPFLWIRLGVNAQIWDNVGFLPIQNGPQFSERDLVLYGFSVMASIER